MDQAGRGHLPAVGRVHEAADLRALLQRVPVRGAFVLRREDFGARRAAVLLRERVRAAWHREARAREGSRRGAARPLLLHELPKELQRTGSRHQGSLPKRKSRNNMGRLGIRTEHGTGRPGKKTQKRTRHIPEKPFSHNNITEERPVKISKQQNYFRILTWIA